MANTNIVHHFLHNGTHVDAPLHFIKDGKSIDSITIEKFIFENPIFLDLPKEKDTFITVDELRNHGFEDADAAIIHTGMDKKIVNDIPNYRFRFPSFSEESARWLRLSCPKLKAVIVDFLSVDSLLMTGVNECFPAHHALLGNDPNGREPILIVEAANLIPLVGKNIRRLFALPIRFAGTEAAPVCLLAQVDD